MPIVKEWDIRTRAVRARSAELKALDNAVLTWATQGQGVRNVNMTDTSAKFTAWKQARAAEYQQIKAAADELEGELTRQGQFRTTQLQNIAPSAAVLQAKNIAKDWAIVTRTVMGRSAELGRLDGTVQTWATHGMGIRSANIQAVRTEFQAWKAAKPGEYNQIKAAADELEGELTRVWDGPLPKPGIMASGVREEGWRLVAYTGVDLIAATQRVGAMTPAEISKVNEAIRRAKLAVEAARDAMMTIAKRRNFSGAMPAEEKAYTDFFGAYDQERFNRVLSNFQALVLAFNGTPNFVDVRNKVQWWNTYGGCVRRNLVSRTGQAAVQPGVSTAAAAVGALVATRAAEGVVTLTGTVEMWMGRSFLGTGTYEKTTDDTVCTLVHEFAHGAIDAVDAPQVDASGVLQKAVVSNDPRNRDFGLSSDVWVQSSQEPVDIILARHHPQYAVVNADSYGQFTKRILLNKHG